SLIEIGNIKFLIGRMQVIAVEAEAHQYCFDSKFFFKQSNNRYASASACRDWLFPKSFLNRFFGCFKGGAVGWSNYRFAPMLWCYFNLNIRRCNFLKM